MRFTDNNDGTVTDNETGLMWQKADDGVSRNWQDAIRYCRGLDLAGHRDWRCPTIRELSSIVDYEQTNPAIDPAFGAASDVYWSSTTCPDYPGTAWDVDFGYGDVYATGKSNGYRVRAVRGGLSVWRIERLSDLY